MRYGERGMEVYRYEVWNGARCMRHREYIGYEILGKVWGRCGEEGTRYGEGGMGHGGM